MRDDIGFGNVTAERQIEGDGSVEAAALLFAELGQGSRVMDATGQDFGDGLGEDGLAVEVEELQDPDGQVAEAATRVEPTHVERVDPGHEGFETITPLQIMTGALECQDLLAVLRSLDELTAPPGTLVPRDFRTAVEKADHRVADNQREHPLREARRDGIGVGVEPNAGRLVHLSREEPIGSRRVLGERQQPRLLVGEHLRHGPVAQDGMRSWQGNVGQEARQFAVAGLDIVDGPARQEALAHEADDPLDTPLLVTLPDGAQAWLHVVVGRHIQEIGVEANGFPLSFQDDALRVVEEPLAGAAAKVTRGSHERSPKRVGGEFEHELGSESPRVGKDHDEHPLGALAAGYGDRTDVGPVALCLFARQWLGESQIDFASRYRAHLGCETSDGANAACVTPFLQHVVQAGSSETGIPLQLLGNERAVGIDAHRSRRMFRERLAGEYPEHATDDVVVNAEMCRDGADLSMLGVKEPLDLRFDLRPDRHRSTGGSRRTSDTPALRCSKTKRRRTP